MKKKKQQAEEAPLRANFVCFVYVTTSGDNTISAFNIGSDGALSAVPGSPFSTGANPHGVAVDPTGQFGYVTNLSANIVSAYRISTTGALDSVEGSPSVVGAGATDIVIDSTGKYVYTLNRIDSTISAFSIGSEGALTPIPGIALPNTAQPQFVRRRKSGRTFERR